MQIPYVLGVDIGTTSAKTIAMDENGTIHRVGQRVLETLYPDKDHREQNPVAVMEAVAESIREACLPHPPLAMAFSSAMHSTLLVDGAGKPLTNAILWSDTRSTQQAEKLKHSPLGPTLHRETGTPIHPMAPLSKIMWLRENQPALFAQAHRFVSLKEWVLHQFLGEWIIDHSMASAMGLFDVSQKTWHAAALATAGISAGRLSKPVPVDAAFSLSPQSPWLAKTGLPAGIPLFPGASDGCLANVGTGAVTENLASVTIGTSGAVRKVSNAPHPDERQQLFHYLLDDDHFVIGGAVNNGGNIIQWFAQQFLGEDDKARQFSAVEALAGQVPPCAEGLLFLPYVFGERAPFWDAKSSGTFIGLRPHHQLAHMARAVMEGVLLGVVHVTETLAETAGSFERVRASGGFAQSGFWVQMLADMLQKPVEIAESHENSAMGAAFLGFKALGRISSWEDAAQRIPIVATYQPQKALAKQYQAQANIFRAGYLSLKEVYGRLENS